MRPFSRINGAWVLALILGLTGASCATQVTPNNRPPTPNPRSLTSTEPDAATKAKVQAAYGQLPLHFEANQGQSDEQVRFLSRGSGYTLFLTSTEAVLALHKPESKAKGKRQRAKGKREEQEKTVGIAKNPLAPVSGERARVRGFDPEQTEQTVLHLRLVGANPSPQVVGLDELPGKSNYFIGNDSKNWHTNIPTYAKVQYKDIYPGIDLIYYGNQRQLEYDFVVAPGADPGVIRIAFDGLTPSPLAGEEGRDPSRDREGAGTRPLADARGSEAGSPPPGEREPMPRVFAPSPLVGKARMGGGAGRPYELTTREEKPKGVVCLLTPAF